MRNFGGSYYPVRLILIMLLVILGLSSDSTALLLAPSHAAIYRFENAVTDDSGRGNNGTNTGSIDVTPGKFGRGRSFDGIDDKVELSQTYRIPFFKKGVTAYSVVCWVKLISDTTARSIYEELDSGVAENFVIGKSTADKCRVYIEGSTGGVKLNKNSTTTIADNTWHHIGWVDNNGTTTLYIDGIPDATNFTYTRSGGTFATTNVAISTNQAGVFLKGDIDEFMLFDKALTQAEVKALMLNFSPGEF